MTTPCSDCGKEVPIITTGEGSNREVCPVAAENPHLLRTGQTSHRVRREIYDGALAASKEKADNDT